MVDSVTKKNPGKQQFLIRWLQTGTQCFRDASQLRQNMISDQTLERIYHALEDELLIRTADDLGLVNSHSLYEAIGTVPDLSVALSTINGEKAMREWIAEHQPILILQALGKAVSKLTSRFIEGKVRDPYRVIRILLVLAFAPFFPRGGDVLSRFAFILNCHEPHHMIEKFTSMAGKDQDATIDKMDQVILSSDCWTDWASWFMEQARALAPQCWGRLVVSKQPADPALWNALWDSLLNEKEELDAN